MARFLEAAPSVRNVNVVTSSAFPALGAPASRAVALRRDHVVPMSVATTEAAVNVADHLGVALSRPLRVAVVGLGGRGTIYARCSRRTRRPRWCRSPSLVPRCAGSWVTSSDWRRRRSWRIGASWRPDRASPMRWCSPCRTASTSKRSKRSPPPATTSCARSRSPAPKRRARRWSGRPSGLGCSSACATCCATRRRPSGSSTCSPPGPSATSSRCTTSSRSGSTTSPTRSCAAPGVARTSPARCC